LPQSCPVICSPATQHAPVSLPVVQEDQSSYLVFTPRIPTHATESLYFASHEVLLSANLLCTVLIPLQKQSKKSAHRAIPIRVLALYLEGLGFESRTKQRIAWIWVRLLLFFLLSRQILCQYIEFIRFVYVLIVYLTMLSVGQYIACLYSLYTKHNNKQYRG